MLLPTWTNPLPKYHPAAARFQFNSPDFFFLQKNFPCWLPVFLSRFSFPPKKKPLFFLPLFSLLFFSNLPAAPILKISIFPPKKQPAAARFFFFKSGAAQKSSKVAPPKKGSQNKTKDLKTRVYKNVINYFICKM